MRLKLKDLFIVFLLNILLIYGFSLMSRYFYLKYELMPILVLILLIFLFKFLFKDKVKDYGFKKFSFKDFKYAIYMLLFIMPIAFITRVVAPGFDAYYAGLVGLDNFIAFTMFNLFIIPLLIKEELVERIIQNKLSKAYGSLIAILFLSVNFGLAHYISSNLFFGLVSVVGVSLGVILIGVVYEKTKNIFLTFIVHLLYDILVVYQIYLHVFYPLLEWIFWVVILGLFLLVLKPGYSYFRSGFSVIKYKKLGIADWVVLILFLVLPIIFFLGM